MKKYFLLIACIGVFSLPLYAVENLVVEPPSFISKTNAVPVLSQNLNFTVTQDGQVNPEPGEVFTWGDQTGWTLPYLVSQPQTIRYPRWAIQQEFEGEFVIAVEILTDGSVGRYDVMKSTGHQILDHEAAQAVLSWKFHPAMKEGQPIVECVQIPIRFSLQDE